jgi:hypothetical protein
MSEAKFTEGDWTSYESGLLIDIHEYGYSVDKSKSGFSYCGVSNGKEIVAICVSEGGGTHKANAHLIAAAPEMYEMLKGMADATVHNYNYETAKPIYALLAKARGDHD